LSNKEKRGQFDRGEIDAKGNPKMGGFDFSGTRQGGARRTGGINPEDILKEFMGGMGAGAPSSAQVAGTRLPEQPPNQRRQRARILPPLF